MGITSLILGMTSFMLCLIPVVGIVAVIPIIISIILGIVNLVKISKKEENKQSRAPAIVGIVLSTVGFVIMIAWLLIIYFAISFYNNYEDDFTKMLNDGQSITDTNNNTSQKQELDSYKDSILENIK